MRKVLTIIALAFSMLAVAQYNVNNNNPNAVWQMVSDMPEYKGGDKALSKYLQQNLHYPDSCVQARIEGTVVCQFIVEKDGTLNKIYVKESSGNQLLDDEALRVVKAMPKWKPGKQDGKAVRVALHIPIVFRLL